MNLLLISLATRLVVGPPAFVVFSSPPPGILAHGKIALDSGRFHVFVFLGRMVSALFHLFKLGAL
jgi:hypothetical protein